MFLNISFSFYRHHHHHHQLLKLLASKLSQVEDLVDTLRHENHTLHTLHANNDDNDDSDDDEENGLIADTTITLLNSENLAAVLGRDHRLGGLLSNNGGKEIGLQTDEDLEEKVDRELFQRIADECLEVQV